MIRPIGRLAVAAAATVLAVSCVQVVTVTGTANAGASSNRYVTAKALCKPAKAHHAQCFGMRVVPADATTPGAHALVHAAYATGPSGGYTPPDLATAYKVNADTATSQVVGIVDAYDDPNARTDLNTFDAANGLPAETSTSFRKVSQTGSTTSLPSPDSGWAGEISLDLDAVRGLCHKCKIVLVEAKSNNDADLAIAENQAVAQGATIISNSFGGAEAGAIPTSFSSAFNHPGVVVLASTGDSGMYDWDQVNGGSAVSANAPNVPSSLNTVVAVGGTTLYLNDDATRSGESVWNENGSADYSGNSLLSPLGATGGGCSTQVTAQGWQSHVANYAQTTCGTKRLPADIAALADPYTGYDIYDSYGGGGWETFGGTSLASPLVAAMWALAGGSGGVTYPSLSLYGHLKSDTTAAFNDITSGGNGLCDGTPALLCARSFGTEPNTLGEGVLDCAWLRDSDQRSTGTRACDAATGYDGPSGVGTPNGINGFKAMSPTAKAIIPATVTHGATATFNGSISSDPFPGGAITSYAWTSGDGTTTTTGPSATATHTYTNAGSVNLKLTVTDTYGRTGTWTTTLTIH